MRLPIVSRFTHTIAILFVFLGASVGGAETRVGSTVESRVLVGFNVNDAAIDASLPEGWNSVTLPQGPLGGSNLIVALIDRHLIVDADGAPQQPSSGPIVAFLAYARHSDVEGLRGFVTRVYEERPLVDPYRNSVAADIDRIAGYSDAGGGERSQSERWTVQTDAGDVLALELDFKVGGFRWTTDGESRPYSATDPDFFRIYRYDQLAGLAMNTAMGQALDGAFMLAATGPDLSQLFDGSELLTAIVTIPTYIREISLP